jgi:2-C-methyl-D-erythritol 4-phosphate cytidylyltransferase
VFVAAGRSERLRHHVRKPYLDLAGRPIFLRTLDVFSSIDEIIEKALVVNADDLEMVKATWGEELERLGVRHIVVGGDTRQKSVLNGVSALGPGCAWAAIHDAVRPFVTRDMVTQVLEEAVRTGAAILAMEMKDTVKESDDGRTIRRTVPRERLWLAQTPQVFPREAYLRVAQRAISEAWEVTDDASIFERAGLPVAIVRGGYNNLKITTQDDLTMAQALAAMHFGSFCCEKSVFRNKK